MDGTVKMISHPHEYMLDRTVISTWNPYTGYFRTQMDQPCAMEITKPRSVLELCPHDNMYDEKSF